MEEKQQKFRILSLDGGGVRGYLSALILKNLEDYLNNMNQESKPIGERFDLIAGTSTGGIIALALALGESASEVVRYYEDDIPKIFGGSKEDCWPWFNQKWRSMRSWVRPKYHSEPLIQTLTKFFENKTLKDVQTTDVCIAAIALQNAKPRFYKTDYAARNKGRMDEKLADIAFATAAAPTYFKPHSMKHSTNLIDGGLFANNPAMVALVESFQFEGESKRGTRSLKKEKGSFIKAIQDNEIVMISIGTGEQGCMPYDLDKLKNGGLSRWTLPIIQIVLESQSQAVHFQMNFLLGGNYLRINPRLLFPMRLDDADKIAELKNLADITKDIEKFIEEKSGWVTRAAP